jgi:hypothetical protein
VGASRGGMHDRWAGIRARSDADFDRDIAAMISAYQATRDPLEKFVSAVTGLARRRDEHLARVMQSAAEGQRQLAQIVADRDARAQRNAAVARAAYRHFEQTRAAWRAEQDQDGADHGPSMLVAAAMHLDPGPLRIY